MFGLMLKDARKRRKLTQSELAKRLQGKGSSVATKQIICHYERGRYLPNLTDVKKLSSILGIPFSELAEAYFNSSLRQADIRNQYQLIPQGQYQLIESFIVDPDTTIFWEFRFQPGGRTASLAMYPLQKHQNIAKLNYLFRQRRSLPAKVPRNLTRVYETINGRQVHIMYVQEKTVRVFNQAYGKFRNELRRYYFDLGLRPYTREIALQENGRKIQGGHHVHVAESISVDFKQIKESLNPNFIKLFFNTDTNDIADPDEDLAKFLSMGAVSIAVNDPRFWTIFHLLQALEWKTANLKMPFLREICTDSRILPGLTEKLNKRLSRSHQSLLSSDKCITPELYVKLKFITAEYFSAVV